jgi:hypothetical protein
MASISQTWGTEAQERELTYPCDRFIPQTEAALYRGVTIDAPAPIVFRWLCQMRVAPYSYDWIDNFGHRSPGQLTPGMEHLVAGQRVMTIFDLVDFEKGRHLTIRIRSKSLASRIFGDAAASYLIVSTGDETCRLLVKLVGRYPRGVLGIFMRAFLPWGDLIMMRRQLLNFKRLAERQNHLR